MSDPLRKLWNALEAGGYQPHGREHELRSRCPAHDGDNPTSLAIGIGADGRALVRCFAHGCEPEKITAALGLQMVDLFPPGHHRARRHARRPLRRSDFEGTARSVVNVLYGLERLGEEWRVLLTADCPGCGHPGCWMRASRDHVDADCPAGCGANEVVQGLLARLAEREKTT